MELSEAGSFDTEGHTDSMADEYDCQVNPNAHLISVSQFIR